MAFPGINGVNYRHAFNLIHFLECLDERASMQKDSGLLAALPSPTNSLGEPSCDLGRRCNFYHPKNMGSRAARERLTSPFIASQARDLSGRQQVAAVCYRISPGGPEFLLVRTRGGHWIFPKGGVQHGLTHAHSAALEAFEEAGVHGRIEQVPFTRYHHARSTKDSHRPARDKRRKPVIAHLCEVSHLQRPQEAKRKPTWFSAEKAKKRLLEDRSPEFGDQLAAVVDRAVSRILRLGNLEAAGQKDELQRTCMEYEEATRAAGNAALIRYFFQARNALSSERIGIQRKPRIIGTHKIFGVETTKQFESLPLRLTTGTQPSVEAAGNIAKIERTTVPPTSKSRNSSR
jgi:8-oxo-dGTP pyrophosphatase MutT (NUDIX family)